MYAPGIPHSRRWSPSETITQIRQSHASSLSHHWLDVHKSNNTRMYTNIHTNKRRNYLGHVCGNALYDSFQFYWDSPKKRNTWSSFVAVAPCRDSPKKCASVAVAPCRGVLNAGSVLGHHPRAPLAAAPTDGIGWIIKTRQTDRLRFRAYQSLVQ